MQEVKKELKSCVLTGFVGFCFALSVVGMGYCVSTLNENKMQNKVEKKKNIKKANYWIPQKDR